LLVFASEAHRLHNPTEPHLFAGVAQPPRENVERADVIREAVQSVVTQDIREPAPIDVGLLAQVHQLPYLEFLRTAHANWCALVGNDGTGEAMPFVRPMLGSPFTTSEHVLAQMGRYSNDADPILAGTWEAVNAGAACAASAAAAVLSGTAEAAYALVRPPGHHAGPETYGGYCYLNNTAIAAQLVSDAGGRVATLDVDTHAGNGTQAVFWERSDVMSVSLHVDPAVEYPYFQGHAHERGAGAGEGFNQNFPMAKGTDWSGYKPVLDAACDAVTEFGAEVVIVALGVDTAVEDGVLALSGDDYRRLGARLARIGRPTVLVQEGGYDLSVLGRNVAAVLEGFEAV